MALGTDWNAEEPGRNDKQTKVFPEEEMHFVTDIETSLGSSTKTERMQGRRKYASTTKFAENTTTEASAAGLDAREIGRWFCQYRDPARLLQLQRLEMEEQKSGTRVSDETVSVIH